MNSQLALFFVKSGVNLLGVSVLYGIFWFVCVMLVALGWREEIRLDRVTAMRGGVGDPLLLCGLSRGGQRCTFVHNAGCLVVNYCWCGVG